AFVCPDAAIAYAAGDWSRSFRTTSLAAGLMVGGLLRQEGEPGLLTIVSAGLHFARANETDPFAVFDPRTWQFQRFSSRSLVDTYGILTLGVGFVVNGFTIHPAMSLPFSLQGPREAWPDGLPPGIPTFTVDWAFNFGPVRAARTL